MLLLVITVVGATELYLRSKGLTPAYNDDSALWAHARSQVYLPQKESVVFIGSSRIKYDLDIHRWQSLTGKKAVQLAMTGSNPRPILEDLANDKKFRGNLVIDVTEPLFFSGAPPFDERPRNHLSYFHDRTPAQLANFYINRPLEAGLVFLDKDNFSINSQLAALQVPNRPGVFEMPIFPVGFDRSQFNEQAYMNPQFVADTNEHRRVINIWKYLMGGPKPPPMPDSAIIGLCRSVKASTDKIMARGGQVFFVRTPSSGGMFMGESMGFPRERFWNCLLKETGLPGFHFLDDPITAALICPEESHLTPNDALRYTTQLVKAMSTSSILNPVTASNK